MSTAACSGSQSKEPTVSDFVSDLNSEINSYYNQVSEYYEENNSSQSYQDTSVEDSEESETIKLDPFEKVSLTFAGNSPYVSASVDTTKCSDEINDNVTFTLDKDTDLRNGDTVTVTATVRSTSSADYYTRKSSQSSSSNNIVLAKETKTFKVENQPEYITSIDGLNLKEMQSEIDDKFTAYTTTNKGDHNFAGVYIGESYSYYFDSVASTTVKSKYLISLKKQFEDKKSDYGTPYNRYIQINEYVINRDNGTQTKVNVIVYVDNITKSKDNTIAFDLDYGAKGDKNYDDIINDYITSKKEFYNVVELN